MDSIVLSTLSQYHVFDVVTIVIGTSFTIWFKKISKSKGSEQISNYAPTLWTSLGILFTFLSIYLSLTSAGKKFEIKELIDNIIPAFSTSIIGIIGAIVSTMINKWSIANREYEESLKFQKIKRQYCGNSDADTPELMLLEIVKSIEESGNKTCGKLDIGKTSSDSKLESIVGSIDTMSRLVSECNEKVLNTIESSQKQQNDGFEKAINGISNTFLDTINIFNKSLESKIQSMADSNKAILEDTIKLQGERLDFIKEKLIEESNKRNGELESFIHAEDETIKEFVTLQGDTYGKLYDKINEQITLHISNEKELFETKIQQSIEDFAKAQYRTSISAIEESVTALINASNEALSDQHQVTDEFINNLSGRLTLTLDSLVEQIRVLSNNMANKMQEIHSAEVDLIESTIVDNRDNLAKMLSSNREEISIVSEHIVANGRSFIESITERYNEWKDDLTNLTEGLHKEISLIATESKTNIQLINSNISNSASSLNNLIVAIESNIKKLVSDYESETEELYKFLIDNAKSLSVDISRQIHDSFSIQQLEETCDNLSSNINGCIADIQSRIGVISSHFEKASLSIEKSSELYADAVDKSNVINQYIQGTASLFKLHKDAVNRLEVSLLNMVDSINQISERLQTLSTFSATNLGSKESHKKKQL